MPNPREDCFTARDYWGLPEGRRAELIDGALFDMAPPSWGHQRIAFKLGQALENWIDARGGDCKVVLAPVGVDLFADESTMVEPDVLAVCESDKVGARGVKGAPDFVAEVVSPSTRRMDYFTKLGLYERAGVREYWIVDPERGRTVVYRFERDDVPTVFPFGTPVPVGVFDGLTVEVGALAE